MEWVIALKNKYWYDPFVRSEVNVVLLQIVFVAGLFYLAFYFFEWLERSKLFAAGILAFSAIFVSLITKVIFKPAKDALNIQKRFISDIAHELRTPLAVIKTNDEVAMLDAGLDPKVRKTFISNIEELDRMSEIINNLLSFNNLVRPERIQFSNINIGTVIDTVVRKLHSLAQEKHLEITIKKISPYVVWGNAAALEQIVGNLLTNAINYSSQNGHITIRVAPDYMGSVLLHIEDHGMGITKRDLLHIFEPFYRAERSRNRKVGSSGLGLTIVRELVKMHSGRITIKSSENKGTVAIVTLPYGKGSDQETIDLSNLSEISVNFLHKKMK